MKVRYEVLQTTCECLNQTWNSDSEAELNAGTSMIMIFSCCVQCYQMPLLQSPTLMTETMLKLAHVHNSDDQRRDSTSWWINHMLGDILFGSQFLVPHLVTTFSVGDSHILGIATLLWHTWRVVSTNKISILSRSVCFDWLSFKHSEKICSSCFLKPLASTLRLSKLFFLPLLPL